MKKILSIILSVVFIVGTVSFSASAESGMPFRDVKEKSWFYSAVKEVYSRGIMGGVSDTEFSPNGVLSRAMFVTILGRLAGAPETGFTPDTFPDTKKNTWYSPYVGWAMEAGIVGGFDDGTFRPNDNLTREQMAKAMAVYIEVSGVKMPRECTAPATFSDEKKIASWAKEYVEVLRRSGIVNGDAEKRYNPKKNITRAEAATIILNLIEAGEKAYQGYEPCPADGFALYGAKYLSENSVYISGKLESVLDTAFGVPALRAEFRDVTAKSANCHVDGTTGLSVDGLEIDISATPYVLVSYRFADGEDHAIAAYFDRASATTDTLAVRAEAGDGWKRALIDLTEVENDCLQGQLLLAPYGETDSDFYVEYYAFFKNAENRAAFNKEDYSDYLENYFLYSTAKIYELTDAKDREYRELIASRIDEIKNTKSELTPEMIKKGGGTCYYISSIHGDDKNDGKSPETPWKTAKNLQRYIANGLCVGENTKPGDGVFFERGSVFYPNIYNDYSKTFLLLNSGVSYGAYGEGEKPIITGALDFGGTNGTWMKTEWKNVWRLDPEQIDTDFEYRTTKCDIGNIIFNGGQYIGIKITPYDDCRESGIHSTDEDYEPFGEGKKTLKVGVVSNGMDVFEVGERACTSPGAVLCHNLEFVQDIKRGELYLYWDGGKDHIENPADAFDDIKVSRNAPAMHASTGRRPIDNFGGIWVDNLALLYSTDYLGRFEGHDIKITNCELGFSNKSLTCVASGFEVSGIVENWDIYNCYFHEIGDGPMSAQGTGDVHAENMHWENNVVTTCGCGVEIWHTGLEEGSYEKDISVKNNIFAYIGAGLIQSGNYGYLAGGHVLNGYIYGCNPTNCVFADNLIYKPIGETYYTYLACDTQPHGWITQGNTYVANTSHATFYQNFDTFRTKCGGYGIYTAADILYSERNAKCFSAYGIDPGATYYLYDNRETEKIDKLIYKFLFITNWYLERPDEKVLSIEY